jgi:IclR family KDG regulon transcriptional repressor
MSKREYDAPAVRKAIALIELLCESSQPLGISEIGERLELNKNMVFRMVRTLTEMGWIAPDSRDSLKYRMTLQPFQHTSKPVARMNIRAAAEEPLRRLWQETQTSCYICILDNRRALCIEHLDATGVLRVTGRVGGHYYLHATAPGKILLAYAENDLLSPLGNEDLHALTRNTITDKNELRDHLRQVKAQGYAIDNMENAEGVLCYAVPVFDYEDKVAGSIGLSSMTFHYSLESLIAELGPLVDQAGRDASMVLGASERVLLRDTASINRNYPKA